MSPPQGSLTHPFDLRAAVLAAADVDGDITVPEVAGKVLANMSAADLESIADAAIRELAAGILNSSRKILAAQPYRSAKGDAIRAQWAQALGAHLHITDGVWKRLADCTPDDLELAAAARFVLADQTRAAGARLQALAGEARTLGAATLGALAAGAVDLRGLA